MKVNIVFRVATLILVGAAVLSIVVMLSARSGQADGELTEALATMQVTPTSTVAPEFSLIALTTNEEIRLEDYRGQVVFLNFWATWCAPCVAEMPAMQRLYDHYRDDGLVVIAVNVREQRDAVEPFIEMLGVNYPVLLDSRGEVTGSYNVRGFPTTMLIDRSGTIIGVKMGFHEWDDPETIRAFATVMEQT